MSKSKTDRNQAIIKAYEANLIPAVEIARMFNIDRRNISKIVKQAGIPLHNSKGPFFRICAICGDTRQVDSVAHSKSTRCQKHKHTGEGRRHA